MSLNITKMRSYKYNKEITPFTMIFNLNIVETMMNLITSALYINNLIVVN